MLLLHTLKEAGRKMRSPRNHFPEQISPRNLSIPDDADQEEGGDTPRHHEAGGGEGDTPRHHRQEGDFALAEGAVIDSTYTLTRKVRSEASAIIYEAHHTQEADKPPVAIKIFQGRNHVCYYEAERDSLAQLDQVVKGVRMLRLIKALRDPDHDDCCCLIMAPFCGLDVKEAILQQQLEPYDLATAIRWAMDTARSLSLLRTTPGLQLPHTTLTLHKVIIGGPDRRAYLAGAVELQKDIHFGHFVAPELKGEGGRTTRSSEVYSWGVLVLLLLLKSCELPIGYLEEVLAANGQDGVCSARWIEDVQAAWDGKVPEQVLSVIRGSLCDAAYRLSFKTIWRRLGRWLAAFNEEQGLARQLSADPDAALTPEGKGEGAEEEEDDEGEAYNAALRREVVEDVLCGCEERLHHLATSPSSSASPEDTRVAAGKAWLRKGAAHVELQEWLQADKALERARDFLPPASLYMADACLQAATVLCTIGRGKDALGLYEQGLQISRMELAGDPPELLMILENMAMAYRQAGDNDKALSLYHEVVRFKRETFGPRHPDMAPCLANIAAICRDMGKLQESSIMYEKALSIQREIQGDSVAPELLTMINGLAGVYRGLGNATKAMTHYQEALDLRKRLMGERHASIAGALIILAHMHEEPRQKN